ncbi:MAG: hypothetical protein AAFU67_09760 [Bacteroidota bacterium]
MAHQRDVDIWFLDGDQAAIVTRSATTKKTKGSIGEKISIDTTSGAQANIMGWGPDNNLPYYREQLVSENNIVPALMATKRDITLGQEVQAYKKIYDGEKVIIEPMEMPAEQKDFFEQLEMEGYWSTAAREQCFHSAVATEFVRGKGLNSKIVSIKALHMRHLRAEYQDKNGYIRSWYWNGNWASKKSHGGSDQYRAKRIPAYNQDPRQSKFIYVSMDKLLCLDEYYPTPYWWGSEEWIRLANCIPEFHQANLRNGYTLRWHIEIPKGYFSDHTHADGSTDQRKERLEAEKAAERAFLDRLNKVLAGVENAGRAVVSKYEINKALAKDFPGIKINPLEVDLKDDALLNLFDKSNQANMSAQGVHPTLANIETAGKLSSGTEIRNAYLMYLAIKTPMPRKQLLKAIKIVKRENNWPKDVHYGFRDMTLEKLSEDKSGQSQKSEGV